MIAICNGTDLSALIGYGYEMTYEPQYGGQMTAIDGTDHSAKLRDRLTLTVPFLPLTLEQLETVLALFPRTGAYVSWTLYDPAVGYQRTVAMKYEPRTVRLKVVYRNGTELWDGLVVKLIER